MCRYRSYLRIHSTCTTLAQNSHSSPYLRWYRRGTPPKNGKPGRTARCEWPMKTSLKITSSGRRSSRAIPWGCRWSDSEPVIIRLSPSSRGYFYSVPPFSICGFSISRHEKTWFTQSIISKSVQNLIHFTGNSGNHPDVGIGDQFKKTVADSAANNRTYA